MSKEDQHELDKNVEPQMGYVLSGTAEYDGRYGPRINLGLGTPPIGIAPELIKPLAERQSGQDIVHYAEDPLHTETSTLLLEGIGLKNLGPEAVVLNGNGSYGAGDEVVRFLALEGYSKILVTAHSFPNVSQWAVRHGVTYQPVVTETLDPRESLNTILTLDEQDLAGSVVYVDYPNNPLGIAEPELVRKVIDHTSANKAVPLIDLAFGEVLGDEYKDVSQYTLDRGGITLGSITKTQGGARLRAGWSIMASRFTNNGYSGDQRMVFGLNDEAEFMLRLLQHRNGNEKTLAQTHAERVAAYNSETNQVLYQGLRRIGLTVLPTDYRTAIQVVVSGRNDFYQRLQKVGIESESLRSYRITLGNKSGYDDSAVRMLTPGPGQTDEVINRVEIALNQD